MEKMLGRMWFWPSNQKFDSVDTDARNDDFVIGSN